MKSEEGITGANKEVKKANSGVKYANPYNFPLIKGEHSIQTDLNNTNPNYSKGGFYKTNSGCFVKDFFQIV